MPEQDLLLFPRFFFFVFLVLLFWWSFSFFITQEVIVLHVIRVSSSELGLCNSPGFINSRWESIFPGESVMPLLRILYLVKTLECTTVKWTHVPCVIIVFCTCKEDPYLLIWKAVLPFSKTFLHHVYPPLRTFRLSVQSCILCKILALFVNFSVTNSWFNQFCSVFQNHSRIKKNLFKIFESWLQYSNSGNGKQSLNLGKKLKNVSDF